ncbi:hypothetical protein [Actinomadura sp. NEAU-AAG7]|uniref:hypothetical protein n=1 Tax=Actinomadura sp. NEAU-AAG7 TaxID=2839640 RepID=UPI001BE4AB5E|nr:hypothetical protein [Actinomadura sp. NEAU-AAG7]MBT2211603.1 hypothetical protein [Actinomadura sp. NEAU-AAG7]
MPEAALRGIAAGAPEGSGVPVLPALRALVPGGVLRPGSVVGLTGLGAASLGAALAAGATAPEGEDGPGGWCGVVGLPEFGVLAAAGMGAVPERLLLVDEPGDRWPDVVAALAEAVGLILLRPPERPGAAAVRRLSALARRHGCVLTLTGAFADAWPGTRLRLRLEDVAWHGLGDGHGRLRGRLADVVAEGPGPARRVRLWFPDADGAVAPAETVPALKPVGGPVSAGGPVHTVAGEEIA